MRLLFAFLSAALLATSLAVNAAPVIVVDAGHGGHDRGGMPGQKVPEKNHTLSVARKVASKLRGAGLRVVMTRSSDEFVGLRERCSIANSHSNAVFLSIHFNGAPRTTASGVETYYYSRKSAAFAATVHRNLLGVMGTPDRGLRQRGFYVVRNTRGPAVLVEPGFLTNPAEARRIASSSFQDRLASALAKAVISRYR